MAATAPRCPRGFASLFSSMSLSSNPSSTLPNSVASSTSSRLLSRGTQVRTHATTRRSTKRLRARPAGSAPRPHESAVTHHGVLGTSATPAVGTTLTFDPPSSAPNPFHTPSIFLPENDPRRRLYGTTSGNGAGTSSVASAFARTYNPYAADVKRPLPPVDRKAPATSGKYHVTEDELKEMRMLRAKDPMHWTRARLAEKFNCSEMFVAIGAPTTREQGQRWWEAQKTRLARQGPKARKAREDRMKRKELWYRDA